MIFEAFGKPATLANVPVKPPAPSEKQPLQSDLSRQVSRIYIQSEARIDGDTYLSDMVSKLSASPE